MARTIDDQISDVDRAVLTPLVRRILNQADAIISGWQVQPLTGGVEPASSVNKVTGDARVDGKVIPWSLILKVIQSSEENGDPSNFRYWKREAQVYQSGILSQLPGGLTAPECFATEEKPDGAFWIWMEDVKDVIGGKWPLEHYGIAARCLGRFNGAYLAGLPLPDQPWVIRHWLRKYLEHAAPAVKRLVNSMDHPLIQRCLPGFTAGFTQQIWDERLEVLELLEHLPRTFCHQDAFRRNLFIRHSPNLEPELVAVDWSYSGIAPVGEEIAPLVHASLSFLEVPPADAFRLEQIVLDGYLDGLRDAGWQGDPDQIRFAFSASAYWRYALGGFAGEMVVLMLEEKYHPVIEQAFGKTVEQIADDVAATLEWAQYLYDQAVRLKTALENKACKPKLRGLYI
jgi:hypothetical protein